MIEYKMANVKEEGRYRKEQTPLKSYNNNSSLNNHKLIFFCLIGLFVLKCEGASVTNQRISPLYTDNKIQVVDVDIIRGEQTEHEPPVTSSDLQKQIPAPPRPHYASTPHYEQQIVRFAWVTPQANTPYPLVKQV